MATKNLALWCVALCLPVCAGGCDSGEPEENFQCNKGYQETSPGSGECRSTTESCAVSGQWQFKLEPTKYYVIDTGAKTLIVKNEDGCKVCTIKDIGGDNGNILIFNEVGTKLTFEFNQTFCDDADMRVGDNEPVGLQSASGIDLEIDAATCGACDSL